MNLQAKLKQTPAWSWIALAALLIAGTALRFYRLGANSLWLDEAGVAYAARASTLSGMLQVVRSHVLAMPLDYLIVWLVGRVSLQEAALRIPAALWGSFSLLLAYRLYRRFVRPAPALLGLLVLTLSPLHIQYSQELRFYSSLVFFYLLVTLLLWDALQQPTPRRWGFCAAALVVGILFHPYVLFALANGLVWLALSPGSGVQARRLRVSFLFCATLGLLAFLVGYLTFSASNTFKIPLMVFEPSPAGALAAGLGWLPFYPGTPGLSWIWGILCALAEGVGVLAVLKAGPRSPRAGLFYSLLLQLAAILGSDVLGHYFFAPRQTLILLPGLCLFAGFGLHEIICFLSARLKPLARFGPAARLVGASTAAVVLVLLLACLPALQSYWQDDKGNSRAVTQLILDRWQPGDSILVVPAFDGFVYKYYLEYAGSRPDVTARLFSADWSDLQKTSGWPGQLFLITPSELTADQAAQLRALGLEPSYHSIPQSRYAKTLWVRSSSAQK